ncbi:MAG: hypothetical protein Q8P46_08420 [Hyphomicrobiales bacterium]|nr:hypothetical protein [Hyphomicrobiales bacterium]
MPDNSDDKIAALRSQIEQRLREQLARHKRTKPHIDHCQIVDMQIKQECERLELMAFDFDNEGKFGTANVVRLLIDDYLPKLAHELRRPWLLG